MVRGILIHYGDRGERHASTNSSVSMGNWIRALLLRHSIGVVVIIVVVAFATVMPIVIKLVLPEPSSVGPTGGRGETPITPEMLLQPLVSLFLPSLFLFIEIQGLLCERIFSFGRLSGMQSSMDHLSVLLDPIRQFVPIETAFLELSLLCGDMLAFSNELGLFEATTTGRNSIVLGEIFILKMGVLLLVLNAVVRG